MIRWNWQQPNWPDFTYNAAALEPLERQYAYSAGEVLGSCKHISPDNQQQLVIEVMSEEALKTSEIEGEYLNRQSIQSSIRRSLGLAAPAHQATLAEVGIAQMMVELYQNYAEPLSHQQLWHWHRTLMQGREDVRVGAYRNHPEPMQVVSGRIDRPTVHFEAPPSAIVEDEMTQFIHWFNTSTQLPPLTRAGLAHLHFVMIHPFEDGNGRIGRALVEKSLAQMAGQPTLIAFSPTVQAQKTNYYAALEANNKHCEVTAWLLYFAQTVLAAQQRTLTLVEFFIRKGQFYDQHRDQLNVRQQKVIERLFAAGPEGFVGGLSAKNYKSLTRASTSTVTRDLQDLVSLGILRRTGERKATRYWLAL